MTDFKDVDSDWKARAQAEREKLKEKLEREKQEREFKLPPANFMMIVSTFATQAMLALGEAEIPGVEGRTLDLESARFAIDALGVLKEKTKGNLDAGEEKALEDVLQGLRLRYVKKANEPSPHPETPPKAPRQPASGTAGEAGAQRPS